MSNHPQTVFASRPAAMVLALSLVAGLSAPFLVLPTVHAAYVVPNGTTELSATPVNQTTAVPPNIMVTFDDSGSMNWTRMGDAPPWATKPNGSLYSKSMDWGSNGNSGSGTSGGPWRCAAVVDANDMVASQAIRDLPMNGVYFNPNINYLPPTYANGTPFPNADATLAKVWVDGIAVNRPRSPASSTGTVAYNNNPDLDYPSDSSRTNVTGTLTTGWGGSDNRWQCGTGSGSNQGQSAFWNGASPMDGLSHTLSDGTTVTYPNGGPYYYRLKKTVTVAVDTYGNPTNTGCTSSNCDGLHTLYNTNNWEAVPITNTNVTIGGVTVNQYQNFANWYAYYRTRNQMARTALSRVFGSTSLSATNALGGFGSDIRVSWQNLNSGTYDLPGSAIISAAIDTAACSSSATANPSSIQQSGAVTTAPDCYRSAFFNWIFQVPASGGTPTQRALARAGEFFKRGNGNTGATGNLKDPYWQPPPANATSSGNVGNELYCRQNFQLLITDGLWNTQNGPQTSTLTQPSTSLTLPDGVQFPTTASGVGSIYAPESDGGYSGYASLSDIAFSYWASDLRSDLYQGGAGAPKPNNIVPAYLPDSYTGLFASGNVVGGNGTAANISVEKYFNPKNDPATWPHMVNYMVGLGVNGELLSSDNTDCKSAVAADADACDLRKGTTNSTGATGWPQPNGVSPGIAANIDDTWHAALASRGQYFSAGNPQQLVNQLTSVLINIGGRSGNATTSGVNASVATIGAVSFSTSFSSKNWSGTFEAVTLNSDGTIGASLWPAAIPSASGRNIYTDALNGGTFSSFAFTAANSGSMDASETAGLSTPAIPSPPPPTTDTLANRIDYLRGDATHEIDGTYRSRTDPTTGVRNVLGAIINSQPVYVAYPSSNYYDGWPAGSAEAATGAQKYSAFVAAHSTRAGTAYVGANDGMLHAFNAPVPKCTSYDVSTGLCSAYNTGTNPGQEQWAFIPRAVYANLGNLTNVSNFQFRPTVDATPVTRDVFFTDQNWHTILAGGVGLGGRGVYTLDITGAASSSTPATAPDKVLWEFDSDMAVSGTCVSNYGSCQGTDLGYTVSQPNIARLNNGEWVVLVSNGYFPDCSKPDIPTATLAACQTIAAQAPKYAGNPYSALFVFDAQTGKMIAELKTPTGLTVNGVKVTSFGLATPVMGDYNADQVDDVAFAGDLQGNLWRFDFSSASSSSWTVTLAYAGIADASGNQGLQPITTMPRLFPDPATGSFMVVFGTGKYLGAGDNSSNAVQGIYGIRDTGACATAGGCAVIQSQLVQQTLGEQTVNPPNPYQGATVRTDTDNQVPISKSGWYIPLQIMDSSGTTQVNSGERVVVTPGAIFSSNMVIVQTLIAGAAGSDPCNPSTQGALMVFNTNNGGPGTGVSSLGGAPVVGGRINNARTSGSLPVVSALGGGQFFIPGVSLSGSKSTNPFTGDTPIWRRRSWSEINQIQ